jgi:hypothetical protein
MIPNGRRRGQGARASSPDTKPTPGRAKTQAQATGALVWTNLSPIYMFAYVVCPNLDATALLSIY